MKLRTSKKIVYTILVCSMLVICSTKMHAVSDNMKKSTREANHLQQNLQSLSFEKQTHLTAAVRELIRRRHQGWLAWMQELIENAYETVKKKLGLG